LHNQPGLYFLRTYWKLHNLFSLAAAIKGKRSKNRSDSFTGSQDPGDMLGSVDISQGPKKGSNESSEICGLYWIFVSSSNLNFLHRFPAGLQFPDGLY
jgi:hypothetical protein